MPLEPDAHVAQVCVPCIVSTVFFPLELELADLGPPESILNILILSLSPVALHYFLEGSFPNPPGGIDTKPELLQLQNSRLCHVAAPFLIEREQQQFEWTRCVHRRASCSVGSTEDRHASHLFIKAPRCSHLCILLLEPFLQ